MAERLRIVTIDGPSGVGKSTTSRRVAKAIGFTYLDTGAMYRAVALKCISNAVDIHNEMEVGRILSDLDIRFLPPLSEQDDVRVVLDGEDVSRRIRVEEIGMAASAVSALGPVRERMTAMQRQIGAAGKIVAEGRDMGTVVFPGAAWKFYLDATPEERARRRVRQLRQRGIEVNEEEILARIRKRDRDDSERSLAPLRPAPDAVHIDSTDMSVEEVAARVLETIRTR
ncbi:MAG TPA: (d)CMP kinase [Desulfobacteraceae bacterium]|nr:(d)CMP kinase [Desulfobacteraceae bacterium]